MAPNNVESIQIKDTICSQVKEKSNAKLAARQEADAVNSRPAALEAYINKIDLIESEAYEKDVVMMGFPMNCKGTDALMPIHGIINRTMIANNCGDPFALGPRPWKGHTLETERELLEKLMKPWGASKANAWGYITTGGTEGVIKGVSAGVNRLRIRYDNVLMIWSSQSHYCVSKAASLTFANGPGSSPLHAVIPANKNGELDLEELRKLMSGCKMLGVQSIMFVATLGSTFKGGNDDLHSIHTIFSEAGFSRDQISVHVDAALNGGWWNLADDTPKYKMGIEFDSISISGHKWYGGFIGGFVMISKILDESTSSSKSAIKYVQMVDKMISGSRPGAVAPLWMARLVQFDWKQEFLRCLENAKYLENRLLDSGTVCLRNYINVVFPKPSDMLCRRHQLMSVENESQVIVMCHITRHHLEKFVNEYLEEKSRLKNTPFRHD